MNLDMTDSMGPGELVLHMHNPLYTYDEYLICIGLGPSISSVICKICRTVVRHIQVHLYTHLINMMKHGFNEERSMEHSCNFLLMPACIGSYVDDAFQMTHPRKTMALMHHVCNLAPISKENKRCTLQHMHSTIVESVLRLHGKTPIFLLFVHSCEWLKHMHVYVLSDGELSLGMSITKPSVYPFHATLTSLPF